MRTKILSKTLALVLVLGFSGVSGAKDTVNNGGGIAEKNILYAYSKLENYISLCFKTEACALNQRQSEILVQISQGLPQEKMNRKQIQFASEKASPGFFIIDGVVRVAKTGSEVAGSIYVNSDLLYSKNPQGFYVALTVEQSVTVLIHELGHHYKPINGEYSHQELDELGIKVASVLEKLIYSTPAIPWNNDVSALAVNDQNSNPDLLVYVFDDVLNLSELLKNNLNCQGNSKLQSTVLYNLYWIKYGWGNTTSSVNDGTFNIGGNLAMSCQPMEGGLIEVETTKLQLSFKVAPDTDHGGIQKYDKTTLKLYTR